MDTSTNGTLLNGSRVGRGASVELLGGETIHFGKVDFPFIVFHLPSRQRAGTAGRAAWGCSEWEGVSATAAAERHSISGALAAGGSSNTLEGLDERSSDSSRRYDRESCHLM